MQEKTLEKELEKFALELIDKYGDDVKFNSLAVAEPLTQFISSREEKAREEGRKEAQQVKVQDIQTIYQIPAEIREHIITQYKEEQLRKLKSKGFDISESDL